MKYEYRVGAQNYRPLTKLEQNYREVYAGQFIGWVERGFGHYRNWFPLVFFG
jgi:hypothetical protein